MILLCNWQKTNHIAWQDRDDDENEPGGKSLFNVLPGSVDDPKTLPAVSETLKNIFIIINIPIIITIMKIILTWSRSTLHSMKSCSVSLACFHIICKQYQSSSSFIIIVIWYSLSSSLIQKQGVRSLFTNLILIIFIISVSGEPYGHGVEVLPRSHWCKGRCEVSPRWRQTEHCAPRQWLDFTIINYQFINLSSPPLMFYTNTQTVNISCKVKPLTWTVGNILFFFE